MNHSYFLGIDIGTFESKGVIIDAECNIIASHTVQHELERPKPGYYEHDAEKTWWHDICIICREMLKKSGIKNTDIKAIGTSTLGADLVPVDENCTPLRKAILYGIDARASKEIREITNTLGEDVVCSVVGRPFNSNDIGPKILWLKNNCPDIYEKSYKFLTGSSFVTAKLTGNYVIDNFLATGTFMPMYQADGRIDDTYCRYFCHPNQLAAVHNSTDIVGTITEQAARETGLAVGTPVTTGTDDSGAEAISVGILQPGDLMLQFGSSLYMIGLAKHEVNDHRIWYSPFIIPGSHSVQGGTNAAGTITNWYRDNIYFDALHEEKNGGLNAFEAMAAEASKIPAGSDGLVTLPYIAGERTPIDDPDAKGVLFGLKIGHTRAHMLRSALESVGYSVAQHLDIFQENGIDFKHIIAIGGGSKNPLWMQIVADITGKEIHTAKVKMGASYGDAIMAAISIGHFQDFKAAAPYILHDTIYIPNPENKKVYQQQRIIFDKLYQQTKDLMHQLS